MVRVQKHKAYLAWSWLLADEAMGRLDAIKPNVC